MGKPDMNGCINLITLRQLSGTIKGVGTPYVTATERLKVKTSLAVLTGSIFESKGCIKNILRRYTLIFYYRQ